MDPTVYGAAMEGKMEILASINHWSLHRELAPNGNTVIHIAAQYGRNEWINELLSHMDLSSAPKLLRAVNSNGETALHVAAREGHPLVIRDLVQHAKALENFSRPGNNSNLVEDIITAINDDGDTALHLALRSSIVNLQDVATADDSAAARKKRSEGESSSFLSEITASEGTDTVWSSLDTIAVLIFPSFAYSANKAGETPLYLAAECDSHQLVKTIAETLTGNYQLAAAGYGGPGGRTALHAAVICNNEENTNFFLDYFGKKDLAMEPDMLGWTPLHCAAKFYLAERVRQLLTVDPSLAYLTTVEEDGGNTALHIASRHGCVSVVEELVSQCAGCWEMVNARGQNVLHIAIENEQQNVIEYFEKSPSLGSLVNQKDIDGNTPVHLAAKYCRLIRLPDVNRARLLKMSFNKENRTPLDLLAYSEHGSDEEKKAIKEHLINAGVSPVSRNVINVSGKRKNQTKAAPANDGKRIATNSAEKVEETEPTKSEEEVNVGGENAHTLVVAALVATVTFTAGITVPGGYNGNEGPNQGAAILLKKTAFQVFVVADTAAFLLATLALVIYFWNSGAVQQETPKIPHQMASKATIYSVLAMVMAFIAGTYSVISPLPSLANTLCVFTSVYFAFVVALLFLKAKLHRTGL